MGVIIAQFSNLPPRIAPRASITIGTTIENSWDSNWDSGEQARGAQITLIINRVEYLAVKPVAIKKIVRNKKFIGENKENSKIKSLE